MFNFVNNFVNLTIRKHNIKIIELRKKNCQKINIQKIMPKTKITLQKMLLDTSNFIAQFSVTCLGKKNNINFVQESKMLKP